jgi:hypothetical protein
LCSSGALRAAISGQIHFRAKPSQGIVWLRQTDQAHIRENTKYEAYKYAQEADRRRKSTGGRNFDCAQSSCLPKGDCARHGFAKEYEPARVFRVRHYDLKSSGTHHRHMRHPASKCFRKRESQRVLVLCVPHTARSKRQNSASSRTGAGPPEFSQIAFVASALELTIH